MSDNDLKKSRLSALHQGRRLRPFQATFVYALTVASLVSCRSSSSSEEEGGGGASSGAFGGQRQDVTGSITSQGGTQAQMSGWIVALIEKNNGSGRVAEVDTSGNITLPKLSLEAMHTMVLLSPDYLIQSVAALPSTTSGTLKQFFQTSKATLPRMVQKGSALTFQSFENIGIGIETIADANNDGVPDGMTSLGLAGESFALTDTDKDGSPNTSDLDIDGDGLINSLDSDDDGDGILDINDTDANGDNLPDTQQAAISDQHFNVGLEFLSVQNTSVSGAQTLKFTAKVKPGIKPVAVKIRGASSLFTGSVFNSSDGTGSWDYTLLDDGKNEDSAAGDNIFGRSVTLGNGLEPRANQVVFFQLTLTEGGQEFTAEFPYTFPNVEITTPTIAYSTSTRIFTLSGDPFGAAVQDFRWIVTIKNSSGLKIYESSAVPGTSRTLTLPANILMSGQTYTYKASAQILDKVAGYAPVTVFTDENTISN